MATPTPSTSIAAPVLLAESDVALADALRLTLARAGFSVQVWGDLEAALAWAVDRRLALAIISAPSATWSALARLPVATPLLLLLPAHASRPLISELPPLRLVIRSKPVDLVEIRRLACALTGVSSPDDDGLTIRQVQEPS